MISINTFLFISIIDQLDNGDCKTINFYSAQCRVKRGGKGGSCHVQQFFEIIELIIKKLHNK